jgi:hypothetical protein
MAILAALCPDSCAQLFVGVWDRDVPVTGAGFLHRQPGNGAPGGVECMICGALYPPLHPDKLPPPPTPDIDSAVSASAVAASAAAAVAIAARELGASPPSIHIPPSSLALPGSHAAAADVVAMLNPPLWLPSEISLLHLGAGWPVHGGAVDKLPPPPANFSLPLRERCARVRPACQLAEPMSWSPLEDERLAIEAAKVAEIAAAAVAEEAKQNADAERRAAAKKRLQLAGSKVAKGLGRCEPLCVFVILLLTHLAADRAQPQTEEQQQQDREDEAAVMLQESRAESESESAAADAAFAEGGGGLSVAEVGAMALEGGWYVVCCASNLCRNVHFSKPAASGTAAPLQMACGMAAELCCVTAAAATGAHCSRQLLPHRAPHMECSGEWCNDVMHGFGQLLLSSGSMLGGCWWKGRLHGLCRHVSRRDGSTYEGSMAHGERRGSGKLVFAWADVYEGEVARDLPNGSGIMCTSAGASVVTAPAPPPSPAAGDTIRGVFKDCEPVGLGSLGR